jgi:DNA-directed RNA polymerase specialized sigma24 family protein
MRDPKEQELLARLQAGEERALVELAATYGSKIYQLAIRYLKNKEDAEEVMQDVLYKVYRNVGTFRGDAALSSGLPHYVQRGDVALRTAIPARAGRRRQLAIRRSDDTVNPSPGDPGGPIADGVCSGRAATAIMLERFSRCASHLRARSCFTRHSGAID